MKTFGASRPLSAAEADRAEVRHLLIGALGGNLAWGIMDGIFYLMGLTKGELTTASASA